MPPKDLPPPSDDDPATQQYDDAAGSSAVAIAETDSSEGGKLKMIVQLVKRCLGVKDIAAMRLSLPASLLEPMPNLEYWHYLDRPDLFAAINDSPDQLERMLAVLRFTFSKDLKFIRGKICKPYNSVLGEHFRSQWDVPEIKYPNNSYSEAPIITTYLHHPHGAEPVIVEPTEEPAVPSDARSVKSSASKKRKPAVQQHDTSTDVRQSGGGSDFLAPHADPHQKMASVSAEDVSKLGDGLAALNVEVQEELDDPDEFQDAEEGEGGVKVVFLTEQISHHPPASSYYFSAPLKGVEAAGVDQISAKVSGTTVRITPGNMNQGIFVSITSGNGAGEEYHITHPAAHVNGVLRGNFYATMTDSTIITCTNAKSGQHLRAIIEYKDESWIGKAQFLLEGVIHTYDPESPKKEWEAWNKAKQVPIKSVVATFEGSWRKKITWKKAGETVPKVLIDIDTLSVVPKSVRPLEEQTPTESRKLWEGVTNNLLSKNYNEATKVKQTIEQKQRDLAAQRKAKGVEFVPVYFEPDVSTGKPRLTDAGRQAVQDELNRD